MRRLNDQYNMNLEQLIERAEEGENLLNINDDEDD